MYFNGDLDRIIMIEPVEREVTRRFDPREFIYEWGIWTRSSLAYAIKAHNSQGSEFPAVVIPVAMQYCLFLQRNLIYTGVTRGKRLVVLVGQNKALAVAVRNERTQQRFSGF